MQFHRLSLLDSLQWSRVLVNKKSLLTRILLFFLSLDTDFLALFLCS